MPREAPVTTQTRPASAPALSLAPPVFIASAFRPARERAAQLGIALERARPGLDRDAAVPAPRPSHRPPPLEAAGRGGDDDAGTERRERLHHRIAEAMHQRLLEDEPVRQRVG